MLAVACAEDFLGAWGRVVVDLFMKILSNFVFVSSNLIFRTSVKRFLCPYLVFEKQSKNDVSSKLQKNCQKKLGLQI